MSASPLQMGAAIWRGITHRVWPGISMPQSKTRSSDVLSLEPETSVEAETHNSAPPGDQQIVKLVRRLFFAEPAQNRQVVISPVGKETDISSICCRTAVTLAGAVNTDVCWIEVGGNRQGLNKGNFDFKRSGSRMTGNLWHVPGGISAESGTSDSSNRLSQVMENLRKEFEYCIIQSSAPVDGETAVLGQFCDGVLLAVRANATRRIAARRATENLESANARLLGIILCDREFPIPESIYRMF